MLQAMLQWGWRLAAEIENSHLIYIYILHPTSNPTKKGTVLFSHANDTTGNLCQKKLTLDDE